MPVPAWTRAWLPLRKRLLDGARHGDLTRTLLPTQGDNRKPKQSLGVGLVHAAGVSGDGEVLAATMRAASAPSTRATIRVPSASWLSEITVPRE